MDGRINRFPITFTSSLFFVFNFQPVGLFDCKHCKLVFRQNVESMLLSLHCHSLQQQLEHQDQRCFFLDQISAPDIFVSKNHVRKDVHPKSWFGNMDPYMDSQIRKKPETLICQHVEMIPELRFASLVVGKNDSLMVIFIPWEQIRKKSQKKRTLDFKILSSACWVTFVCFFLPG